MSRALCVAGLLAMLVWGRCLPACAPARDSALRPIPVEYLVQSVEYGKRAKRSHPRAASTPLISIATRT